jgi:NitT/TauT family transport system substrate-binding protein
MTVHAPSNAADRVLRLGYFPNVTHAQALYARSTGELEKAIGMPVKWVHFNAGPAAIEALFIDAIDATFIGPSPTINGYVKSKGRKFVVIAGGASGGAGLVVRKDSGIRGERDLSGKTIATPQLGNTQDLAARAWLAAKGYKLKEAGGDVTLLPLSNPDQLTMFKRKQIDAAWTVEPWLSRLEREGNGQLLINEDTLWPGGRHVTTHLIMNRQYLARNQVVVKKLLQALVAVTQKINADKEGSVRLLNDQLKKDTGRAMDPEVVKKALKRVELTWDPVPSSLLKLADSAHRIGFLKDKPQLGGIYSLTILNSVLRENKLPEVNDAPH